MCFFFFSSRRRHTRSYGDWSSDVCSSDLFETPIGEEEESHLGDFIEDKAVASPSDTAIRLSLQKNVACMLKHLNPREERIIRMRFGFEDGNARTLEEVGQTFDVTRERIRQI